MRKISCFTQIKILFTSAVIAICLLVIFTLLFLPIYVYRYIVSLMKRIFRRDLGNMVNARSVLFAAEDLWQKPRATIVGYTVLSGHLSVEELRANFRKRILEARRGSTKLHPELEQFPSSWMGFLFWKPEKDFRLDEHIKEYDGPIKFDRLNEEVGLEVGNELLKRPFVHCKSPWEMYALPKYEIECDPTPHVPKTLFLFRIHHSLVDGFSMLNIISKLGGGEKTCETQKPNYDSRRWTSVVLQILSLFAIPYDLASLFVLHVDPISSWCLPQKELSRNTPYAVTPPFPLNYIKSIREVHNNATTTGILVTAITGGLRKFMLESGKGIPPNFTLAMALPVPNHPKKLRNHATHGRLSIPLGIEDPLRRLQIVERDLKALRKSTYPTSGFSMHRVCGSLLTGMAYSSCQAFGISALLSNQSGPLKNFTVCGLPALDLIPLIGLQPGSIGIGIWSLSYSGNLRIGFTIDDSLIPGGQMDVKDLKTYVMNELDNLKICKEL